MFLGVDAGGSETLAIVADKESEVIWVGHGGPGNHLCVGIARVLASLEEALAHFRYVNFIAACFGLSGLGIGQHDPKLEEALQSIVKANNVSFYNDGHLALLGAFLGEPGILVIAGTGSAVLALDHRGMVRRVGGWGHILGDEGSAYHIAMDAIRAAVRAYDGVDEPTSLLPAMLTFFNWEKPRAAVPYFYSHPLDKHPVAKFAPLVVAEAEKGDKVASEVVRKNVEALVKMVQAVVKNFEVPRRVAVVGGVFRSRYVRELFEKSLAALNLKLVDPELPPALAGVFLAMKMAGLQPAVEKLKKAEKLEAAKI